MALKETINDLRKNPDSALNKYLSTGSFGEFGVETSTAVKIGLAIFLGITLAGIFVVIYYKKAVKK
ncbi:hypothetical protein [Edaphocola aurantiacus]|uniref:hypothetical protein n=1 Tax=Edaphocola aurantiacus TaxID=2601682 RepID=UPI001C95893F|nr:hypothetical protein [Edaphocola aurantiacus]